MDNLCICLGYESLVIPLSIITKGESIIIVTDRPDIIQFGESLGIRAVLVPFIGFNRAIGDSKKVVAEIVKSLDCVDLKKIKIHITHKNFGLHSLYMILFAKYGKVFFHKTEIDTEAVYRPKLFPFPTFKKNIKSLVKYQLLNRVMFYLQFRVNISYRYILGQQVPLISDKTMQKFKVNIVDYDNRHKFFVDTYSNYQFDTDACYNLFIHTDIDEISHFVSRESVEKIYEIIYNTDVMCKFHPNRNFNPPKGVNHYPSYIPAELLVNKVQNSVVGLISATFRYSQTKEDIKTISCIELLDWHDEKKKTFYIDFMAEWGNNIIYPYSFNELKNLLK